MHGTDDLGQMMMERLFQNTVEELYKHGIDNPSGITSILFQRGYKVPQMTFYSVRARVIKNLQRIKS